MFMYWQIALMLKKQLLGFTFFFTDTYQYEALYN